MFTLRPDGTDIRRNRAGPDQNIHCDDDTSYQLVRLVSGSSKQALQSLIELPAGYELMREPALMYLGRSRMARVLSRRHEQEDPDQFLEWLLHETAIDSTRAVEPLVVRTRAIVPKAIVAGVELQLRIDDVESEHYYGMTQLMGELAVVSSVANYRDCRVEFARTLLNSLGNEVPYVAVPLGINHALISPGETSQICIPDKLQTITLEGLSIYPPVRSE